MKAVIIDKDVLVLNGIARLIEISYPQTTVTIFDSLESTISDIVRIEDRNPELFIYGVHALDFKVLNKLFNFRSTHPETPFIFVARFFDKASVFEAVKLGASAIIGIDSVATTLVSTINVVLSGGISLPKETISTETEIRKLNTDNVSEISIQNDNSATNSNNICQRLLSLSSRQQEVLRYVIQGHQNKMIAQELGLSENTIKSHLSNILRALGARNRTEVAAIVRDSTEHTDQAAHTHYA